MKRVLWILLPLSLTTISVAQDGGQTGYTVASRSAHETVWQRVSWTTNRLGVPVAWTNSFVELATGLNYFDETTQQWQPSREEWQAYPEAIVALAGRQKVVLATNLNLGGSVDVLAPDGVRLVCNPVGLGFYDPTDGKHVMLAEVRDCAPQWGGAANETVFRDCFEGIRGSIRYLYTKAGFHQHVVLQQRLQLPAGFSDRTRLELYTEFAPNTPPPQITTRVLRREKDPALRAQMIEPDFTDSELDFGDMAMRRGTAFVLGSATDQQSIRVGKRFGVIGGRPVLTEAVEWKELEPLLAGLASAEPPKTGLFAINSSRQIPHGNERVRLPRADLRAMGEANEIQLASSPLTEPSVVIDYELLQSSSNMVLKGDTTWLVSGLVNLSGTTTIEGGSVVKLTNATSAKINVSGTVDCQTGPYRMAIFTSQYDSAVGESIGSGTPTNYPGALVIETTGSVLHDLRFTYATNAVALGFNAGQISLSDVQFVKCQYPIDSSANDENTILLDNSLLDQAKYGITGGRDLIVRGQHVTAHNCEQFAYSQSGGDSFAYLTNCLLVGVTNWGSDFTFTTNSTAYFAADTGGIFQTVGAGAHYLATTNYLNAGTTNISSDLLAALRKKTTYPPIVLSNITITASTSLVPQAPRDTNIFPALGFHYNPIDWLTHWYTVSNAVLTLSDGVAIACYNDTGIWIADGGTIVSTGTPLAPNWFTRYTCVQEQPLAIGSGPAASLNSFHYGAPGPSGVFRFSRFSCPAGANDYHLYHIDFSEDDRFAFDNLTVRDCEFWNGFNYLGGSSTRSGSVLLNNNLFHRSRIWASNTNCQQTLALSNNLVLGMALALHGPATNLWRAYDNAFDSCAFLPASHAITNGYNAYINCDTNRLNPTNAHDVVLTNLAWQTGFLGGFYQPTNSALINAGSLTNAGLAGRYHHTTTTNQVKEASTHLDIGYHYVAVSNGLPVDTDGDSQADYFEDTNGNGVFDTGDFGDWTNFLYVAASFPSLNGNTNSNPLPNDFWRPDVMGAVGPNHFVTMLNGGVAVYARSNGTQLVYSKLEDFFQVTVTNEPFSGTYPLTNNTPTDPRILYDHVSERWFACVLAPLTIQNHDASHVLLAVSKNSDPVGGGGATWVSDHWNNYFVPTGMRPGTNFIDQPSLGVDGNGVYIAGAATITGGPGIATLKLRMAALPKSLLLDSTNTVQTNYLVDYPASTALAYVTNSYPYAKPAVNFDPVTTNDPVWLIAANIAGDTNLYYNQLKWTNGFGTAPVFLMTNNWVQLSATQSFFRLSGYDLPPPHLNTDGFLETRPQTAMVRNLGGTQFLWTCQHIGVNRYGTNGTGSLSADRTAIEWFKIQTTPTVGIVASGRVFDESATNPKYYFYPSLAVNTNGDIVAGFSGSSAGASASDLVGAYYWGKLNTGASPVVPVRYFTARASTNSQTSIKGGDYSSTTLDPVDGLTIWTIQEYAETNYTGYIYGTAIGRVSPY